MLRCRQIPLAAWRGAALIGLSVALFLASLTQVQAAEANVNAPLTYRTFLTTDGMVDTSLGGIQTYARSVKKGQGYTLPTGWARATLFSFALGWRAGQTMALTNVTYGSTTKSPVLYFDWNGDKRFASDEAVKGSAQPGIRRFVRFGPIQRAKPDGSKAPAFFVVTEMGYRAHAVPTGLYEGQANLDGKSVKVGIIDRNLNGRLVEPGGDVMLVDIDGNGVFRGGQSDSYGVTGDQEALALASLIQMPDGRYYRATAAEGGTTLSLAPDATPLGKVRVGCSRSFLLLAGPQGQLMVRGTADEVAVPVGSYRLQSLTLTEKDAAGKYWSAFVQAYNAAPLQVAEGQTVALNAGLPLKVSLTSNLYRTSRYFSVGLADKAGNNVYDVRPPQGGRPAPPALRVATADGKVLKQTSFSYG